MRRIFLLTAMIFALTGGFFLSAADKIVIPAGTELYEKPDHFSRKAGHLSLPLTVERSSGRLAFSEQHPVAWYNRMYPVRVQEQIFYCSAAGTADRNGAISQPEHTELQWWITGAFLLIALFLLWQLLREKRHPAAASGGEWSKVAFAVALRWLLLSALISWWINIVPAASDDPGYFQCARDILNGSWQGPWNYTIGLGIFYMPFILLMRAVEFYDIAIAFDWFAGFVLAPGAMVAGYWLLRRLKVPSGGAFAALLCWAVWPFAAFHVEAWSDLLFPAFFAFPPLFADQDFSLWRYYAVCINAGFNALSDTPGMMVLFLAMLYSFKCRLQKVPLMMLGALWGAACLIRINYILFLPFFFWLSLQRITAAEDGRFSGGRSGGGVIRGLLFCGLWAGCGFLALFGVQLFINHHQFGSPLTFGYILHYTDFAPLERPAAGFTWHTLTKWRNLAFLSMANHLWWTPGLTGLLFMKERFRRNALVWWSLPLVIFFFGYSHTYCDARRFIMPVFIAFIGAFAGLEVWQSRSDRGARFLRYGVLALLGYSWIFTAPFFHGRRELAAVAGTDPALWWITFVPALVAAMVLTVILLQKKEHRLTGVLIFALLYFWFAHWAVTGAILLFILCRALYDLRRQSDVNAVNPEA